MIYSCTWCRYIYDEAIWDEKENIKQWTLFSELEYDWCCPICWEDKSNFMEVNEEILTVSDKDNMTELEANHFPIITIDLDSVLVEVWYIEHPMVEGHFISSVWLYDEYWDIVYEEFLDIWKKPEIVFDISDLDYFEIRVKCNVHWLWTSWLINIE